MDSLTLKRHNFFQNKNNRKGVCNKGFYDICVSWSFPKTDVDTNFFNLQKKIEVLSTTPFPNTNF